MPNPARFSCLCAANANRQTSDHPSSPHIWLVTMSYWLLLCLKVSQMSPALKCHVQTAFMNYKPFKGKSCLSSVSKLTGQPVWVQIVAVPPVSCTASEILNLL